MIIKHNDAFSRLQPLLLVLLLATAGSALVVFVGAMLWGLHMVRTGVTRAFGGAVITGFIRIEGKAIGVTDVIASLQPEAVAIEELYSHYDRPKTAILMGHARGVICLAAAQAGIPLAHYAATQVKKTLTGSGRAPKSQVQLAICREFGLAQAPEPPDVADALAVAVCHIHFQRTAKEPAT